MVPNEVIHHSIRQGQITATIWPLLLFESFQVDFVVDPLNPSSILGVAINEDEAINHRWSSASQPDENVGTHTHSETDAVGNTIVMHDILNLEERNTLS